MSQAQAPRTRSTCATANALWALYMRKALGKVRGKGLGGPAAFPHKPRQRRACVTDEASRRGAQTCQKTNGVEGFGRSWSLFEACDNAPWALPLVVLGCPFIAATDTALLPDEHVPAAFPHKPRQRRAFVTDEASRPDTALLPDEHARARLPNEHVRARLAVAVSYRCSISHSSRGRSRQGTPSRKSLSLSLSLSPSRLVVAIGEGDEPRPAVDPHHGLPEIF